jgi:hypothetical protein
MGDVIRFPQPAPRTDRGADRGLERGVDRDPRPAPLWREAVGQELRHERLDQERTLSDVAGDAGVSTQYLSEVERGRKDASSEMLAAIAGALGTNLIDLTRRVSEELAPAQRSTAQPQLLALVA